MSVQFRYKKINKIVCMVLAVMLLFIILPPAMIADAEIKGCANDERDDAGNETIEEESFNTYYGKNINIIPRWTPNVKKYHNETLTLDVILTGRKSAIDGIQPETLIYAKDGSPVNYKFDERGSHIETRGQDVTCYYRYIFEEQGEYKDIYVEYTDNAGESVSTEPVSFIIDKERPLGEVKVNRAKTKFNKKIVFSITNLADNLSGIDWKESKYGIAKKCNRASVTTWKTFSQNDAEKMTIEITKKDVKEIKSKFYLFLKLRDKAGNINYIWCDSQTIDDTKPVIKNFKIDTKPSSYKNQNGKIYYNAQKIKFSFEAEDVGDTVTGISDDIEYRINSEKWKKADYDRYTGGNISGYFIINSSKYNGDNVKVSVRVKDEAGNYSKKEEILLNIDTVLPEISVKFDNNDCKKVSSHRGYFADIRTATITIKEENFNEKTAAAGIDVYYIDKKTGKKVKDTEKEFAAISKWKSVATGLYSANVSFTENQNYEFAVSYTDEAGNKAGVVTYEDGTKTPNIFTVDRDKPNGEIIVKEKRTWKNQFAKKLSFVTFSNKKLQVTIHQDDATGKLKKIHYYKTSSETMMTRAELKALEKEKWTEYKGAFEIKKNEKAVIYARLEDYSGNVRYISSEGIIVDGNAPQVTKIEPEIRIFPEQSNEIYNQDVVVHISVTEPEVNKVLSGIKQIRYEVYNMGKLTQQDILYETENTAFKPDGWKNAWSGDIVVNKELNNSNAVDILVYVLDNAGNTAQMGEQIRIDTTAPEITISYDNNSPDSGDCYNADRTATIVISERNFNPDNVTVKITNTDGVIPVLSGWNKVQGIGNGDDTTYAANIAYHEDGDYTFEITCKDMAGNESTEVNFKEGTMNPTTFTIDQTLPVISVSYDNNAVQNGKYFSSSRIATIHVTEHNFDVNRVILTQAASLNGAAISSPLVSWWESGDNHIGTIVYNIDGDYTFDVTMSDKAGNQSSGIVYTGAAGKEFTIDTKIDKPVITGVENGKSYKDSVVPGISFGDINFAHYEVTLLRTHKNHMNEDVTARFIKEMNIDSQGGSGTNNTIEKVQMNDGIYTLHVKTTDKAGNEENESVTFTVNRFGSVYTYSEYAAALRDVYIRNLDEDIVITEYNPDQIVEGTLKVQVTRDGVPLEDVDYEVTPQINNKVAVGESGWYQYEYRLAASNFTKDGVYKIIVASEDKAGNMPETSNYEDGDISFMLDTTPAEIINIKGLEKNIINAQSQKVEYEVFDSIGIKYIKVYVNGEEVQRIGEFDNRIRYTGSFNIGAGTSQTVRLVVKDMAGNITDTDSDDFKHEYQFNKKVTISTSLFIRWYANKMLFWGSIVGAAVLAGVLIAVIVRKRKREE